MEQKEINNNCIVKVQQEKEKKILKNIKAIRFIKLCQPICITKTLRNITTKLATDSDKQYGDVLLESTK